MLHGWLRQQLRETWRACLWMVESYERSRSKGERATSAIVLKITSVQPSPTVEVFGSSDIALPENVQSGLGLCLTMASHRARYKHVDYGSRYMAACSVTAPIDGRFFRFRPGGHRGAQSNSRIATGFAFRLGECLRTLSKGRARSAVLRCKCHLQRPRWHPKES